MSHESKLESILRDLGIPASAGHVVYRLSKVENQGDDTLAIILATYVAGHWRNDSIDILNELHNKLGASGIVHKIEALSDLSADVQIDLEDVTLSTKAYIMLSNLAHCIYEFQQIKRYLNEREL